MYNMVQPEKFCSKTWIRYITFAGYLFHFIKPLHKRANEHVVFGKASNYLIIQVSSSITDHVCKSEEWLNNTLEWQVVISSWQLIFFTLWESSHLKEVYSSSFVRGDREGNKLGRPNVHSEFRPTMHWREVHATVFPHCCCMQHSMD